MKRLLPSPYISLGLFAAWLVLYQSLDAGTLLMALIVAVMVPILFKPLRPEYLRVRSLRPVPRYVAHVAYDLALSNLRMARDVLRPRIPGNVFVVIPLDLRDPSGLALLAVVATIVPGTVWSELSRDHSLLLLNVWDLEEGGEEAFVRFFKHRYEKPLMEIFR